MTVLVTVLVAMIVAVSVSVAVPTAVTVLVSVRHSQLLEIPGPECLDDLSNRFPGRMNDLDIQFLEQLHSPLADVVDEHGVDVVVGDERRRHFRAAGWPAPILDGLDRVGLRVDDGVDRRPAEVIRFRCVETALVGGGYADSHSYLFGRVMQSRFALRWVSGWDLLLGNQ